MRPVRNPLSSCMGRFNKSGAIKQALTIVLAFFGIIVMLYYESCGSSCMSLRGDLLGIDLKIVGIIYMAVIIVMAVASLMPPVRIVLAVGLGVEIHLYAFQIQNSLYCPFCLTFSALLIAAFLVNYESPLIWQEKKYQMLPLYFLGDIALPWIQPPRLPLLLFTVLGYALIVFTFSGSVGVDAHFSEALQRLE